MTFMRKYLAWVILILSFLNTTSSFASEEEPAIIMAAFGGDNKGVVRLLDSGVDVNTRDSAGNTALIFAANQGNVELVSILLFRGADPNIKSNGGSAPLQVAKDNVTAGSEYVTVINLLKQYGAEE